MDKQRTSQQNRSLYLYFELLAETLNDAGLDMKKVLKPSIDIRWTKENIKNYLWKPIQNSMYGTKSTTELTTKDIDAIYDVLNRHLGQKLHVESIPFPNIEALMDYERIAGRVTKK